MSIDDLGEGEFDVLTQADVYDLLEPEPHPKAKTLVSVPQGRIPGQIVEDPNMPEGMAVLVDPESKEVAGVIVNVCSTDDMEAMHGFDKPAAVDSWACTGCDSVWTSNPGPFHTHEIPVPGSLSRTTKENYEIVKVVAD